MQTYEGPAIGRRLAALAGAVLASAVTLTVTLLPFHLESGQGDSIAAREATLRAGRVDSARTAAAEQRAGVSSSLSGGSALRKERRPS